MGTFCTSCGTGLAADLRFCGHCGTPVSPISATKEMVTGNLGEHGEIRAPDTGGQKNKLLIGASIALLGLLAVLYYFIFVRDDLGNSGGTPTDRDGSVAAMPAAKQLYAVTQANIRDRATSVDSNIIGKLPRGSIVIGSLGLGDDGTTSWLQLQDGKGFIAAVNLSEIEPPVLQEVVADKIWTTDAPTDIWAGPDSSSTLVDRVGADTKLTVAGLTENDYLEIKLRKNGVGYIGDGARILKIINLKPIAIAFNPDSCSFGPEIQPFFTQLGEKASAEYAALENRNYPNDEARDTALGAVEGKSQFMRLERSFKGLSVTGLAQHYESQSLYFADPPARVMAVFRSLGFKLDKQGQFASTELYAGISATNKYSTGFGKTDLSCGV